MCSKDLRRLSTFAQWPMPSNACSTGITNFASKAAGAYFERCDDCVNDEVMCQSCGVRVCDWSNDSYAVYCKSLAAIHRIISPKCPALNPPEGEGGTSTELRSNGLLQRSVSELSLLENPYAIYLPIHVRTDIATPEQSCRRHGDGRRVQRRLFPDSESSDTSETDPRGEHHQLEGNAEDSASEMSQNHENGTRVKPAHQKISGILAHAPISHPFKPKSGNYDHHFASHRLQTFPRQHFTSTKYQAWAEEGFIFRPQQQNVMCVYCGTVVSLGGHQPDVVHQKMCPCCPFVEGFDVGNISLQQENGIRFRYLKQQAAKKQHDEDLVIKYPQYEQEKERLGTFQIWPKAFERLFPSRERVSAGFFYSGCGDKVVCHCCGVELYNWSEEADVWKTHAAVSPTCLHVINSKGQDFIAQAAGLQVLAEVKYPKAPMRDDVNSSDGVIGAEPGSAVLDMTAVKAALACGYTLPQIQHAIFKFFCQTNRYPNEALLKASLKAADENHVTICKQQQVVLQKDTQLQQTHTQLQQTHTQLQQQGTQLQQKDTQLQQKDTQLQQTHTQLQQTHTQLQERDQTVQTLQYQLSEQLSQLREKAEELRMQEQQIQSLMHQVQQLRADHSHRPPLAPEPNGLAPELNGDGDNNASPSDESMLQNLTCKICQSDKPRMIFLPCGHLFSCAECTSRLPEKRCPVCRQDVSGVLPGFVA